jgi:Zn-dependent peptidase ImmA (M78 family)/transcriptional regulator with XRE-family HTH domain
MTQALITPSVLEWARNRAFMTIDALSDKLSVKTEKIAMWEKGDAKPTFKQAQNVAKALQVPFGYLFLTQPPEEALLIPDLRTIRDSAPQEISATFRELLYEMDRKQQWYKEYVLESGELPLDFIGKFNINTNSEEVIADIRNTLNWSSGFASSANVKDEYIKEISLKAEAAGILIMRNSVLANNTHKHLYVSEFRGFAISDKYAPLIFINTADAKSAQIFTLAHELAHLWIGESGISSVDLHESEGNRIEKFCNKIAAELLMPEREFATRWDASKSNENNCDYLATRFHVSIFATLRRAFDLNYISREVFYTLFAEAQRKFEEYQSTKPVSGGGDFFRTLKVRNSGIFSQAVVTSALEGKLLYRDASALLNIKASKINDYAYKLGIR